MTNFTQRLQEVGQYLHRSLMNIPADGVSPNYKLGHREARHKACEIGLAAASKYEELFDEMADTYVLATVKDHAIDVYVATSQEDAELELLGMVQSDFDYEGEEYDAADISDHLGSMGASFTWTIQRKVNPHMMKITPDEVDASYEGSAPAP